MHMDVFKDNIADGGAFDMVEMTTAIQDRPTVPNFLGLLGIFTPRPIRTEKASVEKRGQKLKLIGATDRGSPRPRRERDRRNIRDFATPRIAETDSLRASEIQSVRAFGTEDELVAMADELAFRQAGLADDHELTMEYHRLGAIDGLVMDADGTTVIEDYFDAFGIARPADITFNWSSRTQVKSFIAQNVKRPIIRALGGRALPGMQIGALCGDGFFDAMQENAEYRDTYLNGNGNPAVLREDNTFEEVRAWGIRWMNYRGTDDASTVTVPDNGCRIFPIGVPDMFEVALSPAESFAYANTRGLDMYSQLVLDPSGRDEFVELDVASYPLHICTTPEALRRGTT